MNTQSKWIFAIVCIAIVTFGFYFFQKIEYITNYPTQNKTIVAFGDSLVQGIGSTNGGDFVSLLASRSKRPIINMGIKGNTAADGLARIDTVIAKKPGIVLVLFGGNDYLNKVPIETTFANLDTIVTTLQKHGSVVILLGIRGGLFTDPYDPMFRKLAKARGALFVPDVLSGLFGNTRYMSDAVHPNDEGYKIIANSIYPVLEKVLK